MTVDRTTDQDGPATLSIFFVPPSSSTKPAAPTSSTSKETATSDHIPADRVESIDMKHKKESEILEQLLRLTGAKVVTPTAREQEELDELAEQRRRSEHDAQIMARHVAAKRRQAEVLEQAKRSVEAGP